MSTIIHALCPRTNHEIHGCVKMPTLACGLCECAQIMHPGSPGMGDFIQGLFDLPQTKLWAQEGFVEIQDWARSRWNYEIQPTCKGKTTKDFVWVSRECLPLIEDVCVDSTWFADHSILYAKFSSLPRPEPIPLWRQPKNIQWKEVDIDDKPDVTDWTPPDVRNASSDDCIQSVMCHLETTIDKTLRSKGKSGLLPNQKGRCMTTDITWGHQHTSPIKASIGQEM